jgi:hypothetical protein
MYRITPPSQGLPSLTPDQSLAGLRAYGVAPDVELRRRIFFAFFAANERAPHADEVGATTDGFCGAGRSKVDRR